MRSRIYTSILAIAVVAFVTSCGSASQSASTEAPADSVAAVVETEVVADTVAAVEADTVEVAAEVEAPAEH